MESGALNARCRIGPELIRAYGLWCWRMGLPMVWFEPMRPGSRLSRVRLELFTSRHVLSTRGIAALIAASVGVVEARHASICSHAAVWDRVPKGRAGAFAAAVFRTVRRTGNVAAADRSVSVPQDGNVVPFRVKRLG